MLIFSNIHSHLKNKSKLYWFLREQYVVLISKAFRLADSPKKSRKIKVLFYSINSLSHSGTDKFLQILAKYLNKELFEVYYLYPDTIDEKNGYGDRYDYLHKVGVHLIPFTYKKVATKPPYFVHGMNPDINKIIPGLGIDILITPGAGCASYPFSTIKNIPIILLNIFGQPNMQKNITHHLCISQEVAYKISHIVPSEKIKIFPVPSEGPTDSAKEKGRQLREEFNIQDDDIVFGRIGRNEDSIHDSIGIEAFKVARKSNVNMHYIIMSPPPILVEQVRKEDIKNVHFIEPSSEEETIWAFHAAIDVLAHFRNDGESFGLNIVESMLSSKPIITHKSHVWNAHLEYLDDSFSRVAEKGDFETYAIYMLELADLKKKDLLTLSGEKAREKAYKLFHIENNINLFEEYIKQSTYPK